MRRSGQLDLEDLKSPSGGNSSGDKYHFRREDTPPTSDETSWNKSCCLNSLTGRYGDFWEAKNDSETTKGSVAFQSLVSFTSCSCFLVKSWSDIVEGFGKELITLLLLTTTCQKKKSELSNWFAPKQKIRAKS